MFQWITGDVKCPLECLVEGPAGTGKTHAILQFVRTYVETFPGVTFAIMREIRADMAETVLAEWEDSVLGLEHPAVVNGPTREHRDSYEFPNGSRVLVRGYDKPGKLFSGQLHGVYFCEMWQTTEDKWQQLHRAIRGSFEGIVGYRGEKPFRPLVGDVNPQERTHWANLRAQRGKMHRIMTRLWHNPRWYGEVDPVTHRMDWFEDGRDFVNRMRLGTSGVQFERLFLGNWTTASGAVFPEFDSEIHEIDARWDAPNSLLHVAGWDQPVSIRWCIGSKDVGLGGSPGCFQIWGVDPQNRMFRLAEIYRKGWNPDQWAREIVNLCHEFKPLGIVCDHDKAMIHVLNQALHSAGFGQIVRMADKTMGMPGDKAKNARIEMMRLRLVQRKMFWVKKTVRHADLTLPSWCSEVEVPSWRYQDFDRGSDAIKTGEKPDPTQDDHGIDATLYGTVFVHGRTMGNDAAKPRGLWQTYWDAPTPKKRAG